MTEQELILSAILKITPILSIYFWGTMNVFLFAAAVTLMIIPDPKGKESFKKLIFYSFCAFAGLLGIISNVKDFFSMNAKSGILICILSSSPVATSLFVADRIDFMRNKLDKPKSTD